MSMGIFTLALAANEQREAAISGEYFELRNALSPIVLVELLDAMGGVVCRLDNPEQSDFVKPGYFQTVRFTNGPVAQTVRYFYGSGDAGSRRTSGLVQVDGTVSVMGNVAVIDGEKARTLAGGMYAGAGIQAGLAANVSAVQLWNPLASGKNIIVSTMSMGSSSASGAQVYTGATMYATDLTAGRAGSKLVGGAAGVAQLRADYAAAPPAYANSLLRSVNILANTEFVWNVRGAIVVPPGKSINVISTVVNTQLVCNFEWFEETV